MHETKKMKETLCPSVPRKYLLLTARHQNWSMMKAGDWNYTEWLIYSDGTFFCKRVFNPTLEEWERINEILEKKSEKINECPWKKKHLINGKLATRDFNKLLDALETDPWRPDGEAIHACDGSAWELRQFDKTGKTIRHSGRLGYICGNAALEQIVSLLPLRDGSSPSGYFRGRGAET